MKENLRNQAITIIEKFKFVLENLGAKADQETLWIQGEDKSFYAPKSITQYLDGFSLEQLQAVDLVIRKEYDDSKALMAFANKELSDYIFVRQREQLVAK